MTTAAEAGAVEGAAAGVPTTTTTAAEGAVAEAEAEALTMTTMAVVAGAPAEAGAEAPAGAEALAMMTMAAADEAARVPVTPTMTTAAPNAAGPFGPAAQPSEPGGARSRTTTMWVQPAGAPSSSFAPPRRPNRAP